MWISSPTSLPSPLTIVQKRTNCFPRSLMQTLKTSCDKNSPLRPAPGGVSPSGLLSSSSLFPTRINTINRQRHSRRLALKADQCVSPLSVSSSQPKWAAGMHDLFDFPEKPGLPLVSPHTSSNKALFVCALREMNVLTLSQNVTHLSADTSQKVKRDVRKVLSSWGLGEGGGCGGVCFAY